MTKTSTKFGIVFSIIGLIDAAYLLLIKYTNNKSLCIQGIGDCWSVNTSPFSEIYGVPVSLLGLLAYLVMIILYLTESKNTFWSKYTDILLFGLTLIGVLYSAYLTYLEIAVIKAICPFCVISALVMLILFGNSIYRLAKLQSQD